MVLRLHAGPTSRVVLSRFRVSHVGPSRLSLTQKLRCWAQAQDVSIVAGIDLGTTNSAIAVIASGRPEIVPNKLGRRTTPSVVTYLDDGTVLVGEEANRRAAEKPKHTFYSSKRFIGRDFESVRHEAARVAYEVDADEDGACVFHCDVDDDGVLYPEEIGGQILAELLQSAEDFTGQHIKKAVISVPAYFTEDQREATITAGRIAGLEKVHLIREPEAAALAYGLDATKDETVLVFDLGGGTFDVSILEVGGGVIEVLATGGDAFLGGDDFDRRIADWLVDKHLRGTGYNTKDPALVSILKRVSEAAKIKLSDAPRVTIRMPVLDKSRGSLEAVLTRQEFEKLTMEEYRRARLPIDEVCWQAGVDLGTVLDQLGESRVLEGRHKGGRMKKQGEGDAQVAHVEIRPKRRQPISQVLLVGGATRMPGICRFLKNMTGLEPREFVVDPDEAVALGAAVQAGILEGSVPDMVVMDVWKASLMRALAQNKLRQDSEAAQRFLGTGDMGLPEDSQPEEDGDWD